MNRHTMTALAMIAVIIVMIAMGSKIRSLREQLDKAKTQSCGTR